MSFQGSTTQTRVAIPRVCDAHPQMHSYRIKDEVVEWLNVHSLDAYMYYMDVRADVVVFIFLDANIATIFKLVWG